MNNYISQYEKFTASNSTPSRFLKIPITNNKKGNYESMVIELNASNGVNNYKSEIKLTYQYTESSGEYNATLRYSPDSNTRIAVKGVIIEGILYLYAKVFGSGLNGFARVVQSSTPHYKFENVSEAIPTSGKIITCIKPPVYTLASGVIIDTTYNDASFRTENFISICCGITINTEKANGTGVFTGLGEFMMTGIAINYSLQKIVRLRINQNGELTSASEPLTTGQWTIIASGRTLDYYTASI